MGSVWLGVCAGRGEDNTMSQSPCERVHYAAMCTELLHE